MESNKMLPLETAMVKRFLWEAGLNFGEVTTETLPAKVLFNIIVSQHERIKQLEEKVNGLSE